MLRPSQGLPALCEHCPQGKASPCRRAPSLPPWALGPTIEGPALSEGSACVPAFHPWASGGRCRVGVVGRAGMAPWKGRAFRFRKVREEV